MWSVPHTINSRPGRQAIRGGVRHAFCREQLINKAFWKPASVNRCQSSFEQNFYLLQMADRKKAPEGAGCLFGAFRGIEPLILNGIT